MLWCEAVVDGDDDGGDFLSESLAKVVEGFRVCGKEAKPTTMEVKDDWEAIAAVVVGGGGGGGGNVEAKPKVSGGIDCEI